MRITQVDKQATLDHLYHMLSEIAESYIHHRHSVIADKVFWNHMHEVLEQPYVHLDYSQNIELKPKHEVQSQHYSGKQQTLHCTGRYWTVTFSCTTCPTIRIMTSP